MNSTSKPCPFCTPPVSRIVEENELAVLILDGFPASTGHSLVIPKRHVGSFFEITDIERAALFKPLDRAQELVSEQHQPDGFNIGISDGAAAGQTVPHLHIHCWRRRRFNPMGQFGVGANMLLPTGVPITSGRSWPGLSTDPVRLPASSSR